MRGRTQAPALCQEPGEQAEQQQGLGLSPRGVCAARLAPALGWEWESVQNRHAESWSEPPSRFTLALAKLLGYRKPEGVKAE